MFGFSAGEMLLIAFIALILFGNEKLPQNIKKFLKGWNQTKKVALDMQNSWHEIKTDIKNNVDLLEEDPSVLKSKKIEVKMAHYNVSQEEIDSFQTSLQEESKHPSNEPQTISNKSL